MAIAENFWRHVERTETCWVWRGATLPTGYGHVVRERKSLRAHRMAWELAVGPVPEGLCVLHRCDNRRCVRPDHLFLGTYADNNRDRALKGRSATGNRHGSRTHPGLWSGQRNGRAKLSEEAVGTIRAAHAAGETPLNLARRFGVSRRNIYTILGGKSWGWSSSR